MISHKVTHTQTYIYTHTIRKECRGEINAEHFFSSTDTNSGKGMDNQYIPKDRIAGIYQIYYNSQLDQCYADS